MTPSPITYWEAFQQDGYCTLSWEVLPLPLINMARRRAELVRKGIFSTGIAPQASNADPDSSDLQQILQIHNCDPILGEVITHPKLGKAIAEALECTYVKLLGSQLYIKPGNAAPQSITPWHRDAQGLGDLQEDYVTAWIPLEKISEANGTLYYLPGSHRFDVGDPRQKADQLGFFEELDWIQNSAGLPDQKPFPVSIPPGGISIHHPEVIHGSAPNNEKQTRYALALLLGIDFKDNPSPIRRKAFYSLSSLDGNEVYLYKQS